MKKPGAIRSDFPTLAEWRHFNCGGMAPMPTSVGAELLRVPTEVIKHGPNRLLAHEEAFLGIETARQTLAGFLGADADEIAFTLQFSTAVNIVVEGFGWNEGDHFIVTDQEHPALLIPLMNAAKRFGLTYSRIPVAEDPDEMLASFDELWTDRTRLVAVSHVTTDSGTRLPVEEMTKRAHDRGAKVLYDGAHSVGQFALDLHALNCDFYALVGYKWLLGPYPSAALYIRNDQIDEIEVTWSGSRATKGGSVTMGAEDIEFIDSARRFEYGGQTFSYHTAMVEGLKYVDDLGIANVELHARKLTERFHAGLAAIPNATVMSPKGPVEATGICSVKLANLSGVDFSKALRDRWNVVQRPSLWGTSVRFSLACFIDEQDIDELVGFIDILASDN
jgi:cysteine desulfurase/selenocysteine lyase